MNTQLLLTKALQSEWLSIEEGTYLFKHATLGELMAAGHALRQAKKPGQTVTWIIDRNSNTTNVCVANCKFCNFYRVPGHSDAYITSLDQYIEKIEELFRYGGEQLLLQGGHHPDLGLDYYTKLFRQLKAMYPTLKLHALGP
ncbi:MAG: radical SAM protein, partial [Saprospiraceae bacterium]